MFAGFQEHRRRGKCAFRDRQVDDNVDSGVGKQIVDLSAALTPYSFAGFGGGRVDVGAGNELHAPEERQSLK